MERRALGELNALGLNVAGVCILLVNDSLQAASQLPLISLTFTFVIQAASSWKSRCSVTGQALAAGEMVCRTSMRSTLHLFPYTDLSRKQRDHHM